MIIIIIIRSVAAQSDPREKPHKHRHGRRYDNNMNAHLYDTRLGTRVRTYARTRGMRYTYTRYTVYDVYNIIAHIILLICAHTAAVPTYIGPPRENLSALLLRRRDSVLTLITTGARVYR